MEQSLKVQFEMQAHNLELDQAELRRKREIAEVRRIEDYMFSLDRYDCNYMEEVYALT